MKIFILLTLFGTSALALPKSQPSLEIGIKGPPERILIPGDVATASADNIPRIIGGEDAKPGQFPHQISLQVQPTSGEKYHSCGGSILDETHIICAAHCVERQDVASLEVVAGAHNMKIDEPQQQRIKVESFVYHPAYDYYYLSHDASIIKLATPLVFNDRVQPIRIAPQNQTHTGRCVNTGWGNARPGGGTPAIIPDALQFVTIEIVTQERCKQLYSNINPVDDTMVCAGDEIEGGKGSCNGDSGGPLVCKDKDGVDYLAGIVSWGMRPCAQAKYPTVFGNVGYFSDWFKQQAEK